MSHWSSLTGRKAQCVFMRDNEDAGTLTDAALSEVSRYCWVLLIGFSPTDVTEFLSLLFKMHQALFINPI